MEGGKWEDLHKDIMVNVLGRVGMESLLLDVPFVCKSWYKASRDPHCWEHLIFPSFIKADDIWEEEEHNPDRGFAERLAMKYGENLSVTAFVKFIVNRSGGNATLIKLPGGCTEEALDHVANHCPRLKGLAVGSYDDEFVNSIIPRHISKWKNLEMLRLGKYHLKEIIPQIGLHCKSFFWLSAPYSSIGEDEACALVSSLSQLKYLDLHGGYFEKEALVMILLGCKKLVRLDVSKSIGFFDDDAEILELASHIPVFKCDGSTIPNWFDDDYIDHDDLIYDSSFFD